MSDTTTTTVTYYPPFTITSVSVQANVAYATYRDSHNVTVPPGTSPITVPAGTTQAAFQFARSSTLRLVAGTVKTIGNDPTMYDYNFLSASSSEGGTVVDTVTVPWDAAVSPSTRGLVLLFAQLDKDGNMLGFVPTTDPQVRNDGV